MLLFTLLSAVPSKPFEKEPPLLPPHPTAQPSPSAAYPGPTGPPRNPPYFGNPIIEGHHDFLLIFDMLTGIRISVSRAHAKVLGHVEESEFKAAHKLAFDSTGNELNPTSKYDFKFKDYAPTLFRRIRDFFHLDSSEYLLSLTGKYILGESATTGKSGSFFYYSRDYRFIINSF
jgi:1-phosphatidylinositol-4-phosphate 5-kinase